MPITRYRSVCFTYFIGEKEESKDAIRLYEEKIINAIGDGSLIYGVFQEERCPDTNRLHLQGYLKFGKQWSFKQIKEYWGSTIHIERTRGSPRQASDYCQKSESRVSGPYKHGEEPKQGKRSDLLEIQELIEKGTTEKDIAQTYFNKWCVYRRSFAQYRSVIQDRRNAKTKVFIFWGDAGTGKTRSVYDYFGYDEVYDVPRPNGNSVWFNGYTGQTCMLVDDFYGWIPLHLMLKLGDRYPLQLPSKGGFVEFNAKYLVITSNEDWEQWYNWEKFSNRLRDAFQRRIDGVVTFTLGEEETAISEAKALLAADLD